MDILIRSALVQDGQPPLDIGIREGVTYKLEPRIDDPAAQVLDAAGRATIPGLIEPHIHLDKALLESRLANRSGTLEEAIRVTGILKTRQEYRDVLDRSRQVLDMAVRNGTVAMRCHPDVDTIQGLIGIETLVHLRKEYAGLIDLQIVAFPQEGILKSPGTLQLMTEAIEMGADVVGGCPYNELGWEDSKAHIEIVFRLAQKFGRDIDLHADFADSTADQRFAAAAYIAQKTIDTGYHGRVTLGHLTSLGALRADEAGRVIDLLAKANINVVTLPATDVYLSSAKEPVHPRRGLTPIRALREAGVNVAYSSNNIRNAFTPFGTADPLQIGWLLAHVAQFGSPDDRNYVLEMCTHAAARVLGITDRYGVAIGKQADLVILDTHKVGDALLDLPVRRWVIKRGRVTVEARQTCTIYRTAQKEAAL